MIKRCRVSKALLISALVISMVFISGCFVTKKDKEMAESSYNLGIDNYRKGLIIQALRHMIEAEKSNPKDPEIQNLLGMCYFTQGRKLDLAEKHLIKATKLLPDFSEAWNNLGTLYMETGDLDKAKKCFETALENVLYVTPERSLFNLGMVYYKRGVFYKAVEYFEQAYRANKRFAVTRYYLGLSYLSMGRSKQACEHLCFVGQNFPDGDLKRDARVKIKSLSCRCLPPETVNFR